MYPNKTSSLLTHYSNIPIFHLPMVFVYGIRGLPLIPDGGSFLRLGKYCSADWAGA